MNIIDKTADYAAKSIRKYDPVERSEAVLKYALIMVLNTISVILSVLFISLLTGHFAQAVLVLVLFALLRYFSGGVHLHSSVSCTVFSTFILVLLAHISFPYWPAGPLLDAISILMISIYAPSGIEQVSRISPKYYPVLKVISLIIVSSDFIVHSPAFSAVFFAQAFTLTPWGYKSIRWIEGRRAA